MLPNWLPGSGKIVTIMPPNLVAVFVCEFCDHYAARFDGDIVCKIVTIYAARFVGEIVCEIVGEFCDHYAARFDGDIVGKFCDHYAARFVGEIVGEICWRALLARLFAGFVTIYAANLSAGWLLVCDHCAAGPRQPLSKTLPK